MKTQSILTFQPYQQYLQGYWDAISDFGIWNGGYQRIGCLETPIGQALARKMREVLPKDITEENFEELFFGIANRRYENEKTKV